MFVLIGVIVGLGLLLFVAVVTMRRGWNDEQDVERDLARLLGLSPNGDRTWVGSIDGLQVTVYPDWHAAAAVHPELFPAPVQNDGHPTGSRRTLAILVPDLPARLRLGANRPEITGAVPTGDPQFDRAFAVHESSGDSMVHLTEPRRLALLTQPIAWVVNGHLLTHLGRATPAELADRIRAAVSAARRLA